MNVIAERARGRERDGEREQRQKESERQRARARARPRQRHKKREGKSERERAREKKRTIATTPTRHWRWIKSRPEFEPFTMGLVEIKGATQKDGSGSSLDLIHLGGFVDSEIQVLYSRRISSIKTTSISVQIHITTRNT